MEDSFIVDLYWRRDEQAIAETERKYGGACEGIARRFLPRGGGRRGDRAGRLSLTLEHHPAAAPGASRRVSVPYRTERRLFPLSRRPARRNAAAVEASAALDELAECVAGRDNVEQIIEARELSHAVNAFLHTLSRNDRIIFTARYYLALPAPAIAERLGCREGRVHTSLCRSRKKLRDYLIKEELL